MPKEWAYRQFVDGIWVRYDSCAHCGRLPSAEEIQAQLLLVRNNHHDPCAICGEKPRVTEITLEHTKREDLDRWGGDVLLTEELMDVTYDSGRMRVKVHPACAQKAMPHARWG